MKFQWISRKYELTLLYKIMCSEFLLSSLFEEIGIYYKYLNVIHNFEGKILVPPLSTLAGKIVFLKISSRHRKHKWGIFWYNYFTGTLHLKKHCSFLLFSCFGGYFSPMFLINAVSIQIKTTHFISKKPATNAERFLGIPCSGQLSLCSLSVQHSDAQASIEWAPIYILYHFSLHTPLPRQFAEFNKNPQRSTQI